MDDRSQYDYFCTYCLSGYDHPDQFYAPSLRKYVCRACAKELGLNTEEEKNVPAKSARVSRKRRNAVKD